MAIYVSLDITIKWLQSKSWRNDQRTLKIKQKTKLGWIHFLFLQFNLIFSVGSKWKSSDVQHVFIASSSVSFYWGCWSWTIWFWTVRIWSRWLWRIWPWHLFVEIPFNETIIINMIRHNDKQLLNKLTESNVNNYQKQKSFWILFLV